MQRTLLLSAIVAFTSGCGASHSDKDQQQPSPQKPVSAQQELPAAPAGIKSTTLHLSGSPRKNKYLQLEVVAAGFDLSAPSASSGMRYFTVGLRGIALSRATDVAVEIRPYVFAQNERGCIYRPLLNATWLSNPFGEIAVFTASGPTKGQLAFLVPEDTQGLRVLIASAAGNLTVYAGDDFTPSWPTPIQTIEDGSTLRIHVLPDPAQFASLPPPAVGHEYVVLDFVIENLTSTQGIEFATSQQLRLVDPSGKFVQLSALTSQLGCRLDDGDLVPPGHARRLMAVYDMPVGVPRRLQYRGFEVDEVTVGLE